MLKLVRDRIPGFMVDKGLRPVYYALNNDDEFSVMLAAKLDEEVAQLKGARKFPDILEEAADVLEVLTSIVTFGGYSLNDLLAAYHQKNHDKGGFENRIVMEVPDL